MTPLPTSLVDVLRWRAKNQPRQLAYRYLRDGEYDEVIMTYEDLDRRARSIAVELRSSAKEGDRALIIFPPGLDFIAAYFGCLYAKILAIPVYPPHPASLERNLSLILRIAADANPAIALLNTSLYDVIKSRKEIADKFGNIKMLATDNDKINDGPDKWQLPEIKKNDLAFLQYTSGSTSSPRGVMISHGNLLHNLDLIGKCFGVSGESHAVSWLPAYHDMGLIGGILQPLYSGFPITLIPHMMFLQRPFRWLQTISRYHATISGGPNFAYDLCIKKIKPEQKELLDLSSWEVAFNGAEPVYHKTLDQFAAYFASRGFRRKAFLPCYGLAESTLMVTGAHKNSTPLVQHLMNPELAQNRVIITPEMRENTRALVSCGQNISDQDVQIVNVETLKPCAADEIGEIWVSGPSVASGYWKKSSETEFTFNARLSNTTEEKPYLRTGDLGFLYEGELYVTGRIKNLIISEGKNHYSHDIERTVETSHPAIRQTGCAVFSICKSGVEDLIVIAEIEHKFVVKTEEVIKTIREAVSLYHGLRVDDIRLTKPGAIPRTTSGKIRHFLCKEYYMTGSLKEIV
jgi:acyl-CoA synthetase (AMP-forming)/AMP-acid ligase II